MAITSRWIGSSISTPPIERRPFAIGRQRHYEAVELLRAGEETTGQKISVDDVVEVVGGDDSTGIDSSSSYQRGDSGRPLRLAQVGRQCVI